MKSKVFLLALLGNLLLTIQATNINEKYENITILEGTNSSYTSKEVVEGRAIVIHTQLQHYDEPTLKEYEECHRNLEQCKNVCEGVEDPIACAKQCPVCPFLVKEQIVVQGINDTEVYSAAKAAPLNTTNIIRLSNQIQNIIESHQGNITVRNDNLVHVHQNTSRVGGKFGLGYNNTDPCCILVNMAKSCDLKKFSSAKRCHHKRHRVCGKQCKARLIMAKRVTQCDSNPLMFDSNEDYIEENCRETIKYVPYHPHRRHNTRTTNRCRSIPSWPYVACSQSVQNYENLICRRCQSLTYYHILQRGLPAECSRCFMSFTSPTMEMFPSSYSWYPLGGSSFSDNTYGLEDNFDLSDSWQQEKTKCRLPNGEISENCQNAQHIGDLELSSPSNTLNPLQDLPEAQDEYIEYNNEDYKDDLDFEDNIRRRRQTFKRSKYSRIYGK
ncbi:uncharacterized protein LOC119612781 [Lucilia sericata]|uniref:uncharacterized protein LOC119612781 n=1 Tax=Lucilia sericata TaxID=13632 RepID=UPI0018A871C5|nr:uncharacterized protein LOC119612781 [Lucilia sericata]